MRKMALGFTAGGQKCDVSSQMFVSQQGFSRSNERTFGSFERASICLKNATAYEDNESGQGGLFCNTNHQVNESIYISALQSSPSLDPLEEKLLLNIDDNPWESSSGNCVKSDTVNALGHTNGSLTFPTIQCGSWSALMQSTLAETSNEDTGILETWSGFTFQNAVVIADSQSATPVIFSSIPQKSLFQGQQVSGFDGESQMLQTASYSVATESLNSVSQHYTDSDALPVSQPATEWTAVQLQKNLAGGESEMVQGSDLSVKDVERIYEFFQILNKQESENVIPWGASSISVLKHDEVRSQRHISSDILDANRPLKSEMQESTKIIGGCSVKNTSMNQMNASILPVNTVAYMPDHQASGISRPNKRKSPTTELLPWHKEMISTSVLLPDTRKEEREWGQATNQLIEVEIDAELCKPDHSVNRPRKRLILTTRFMQKLLLPAQGTILSESESAALSYESVVFIVARLMLADACSKSAACDKTNCNDKIDLEENMKISETLTIYRIRIKKLEDSLQRLDSRPSLIDINVQYLELERFSMINRFAKFHSRIKSNPSGVVSSSPPNMYLQRYVVAQPFPKDLPDGLQCVAL